MEVKDDEIRLDPLKDTETERSDEDCVGKPAEETRKVRIVIFRVVLYK